ncbi:MAG: hypothetical protein M0Z81_11065 [Deltaproteobacteria bacterium]|nr:hypothetical protein [Deltaproteobacteria bacterium]
MELLGFIKGIVRSSISHLADGEDNRAVMPQSLKTENGDKADPIQVESCTPEQSLIQKEDQQILLDLYERVLKRVEGNQELESLAVCMMEGIHEPKEMEEITQIPIKRIYQLRR